MTIVHRDLLNTCRAIIQSCQDDLGHHLTAGQMRDLLCDNTPHSSSLIHEIVAHLINNGMMMPISFRESMSGIDIDAKMREIASEVNKSIASHS